MPPYLAIPHFHLSKLPLTTKVALTGFSLAILTAILFVALVLFAERTGYRTRNVQANFAGDERVRRETGHRFDSMHAEPSRRALYDIVHPHSFMMPLIYFVLCHLMEMSFGPRAFKISLYAGSFVAMMLVIFAPLLVSAAIGTAPLVLAAMIVMALAFAAMALIPMWQMWFSGASPHPGRAP